MMNDLVAVIFQATSIMYHVLAQTLTYLNAAHTMRSVQVVMYLPLCALQSMVFNATVSI